MINLIKSKTYHGDVYLNTALIAGIDFQDTDAYVRAGNVDYRMSHESALALIAELQAAPGINTNALVLATITTLQRDETKNNRRPMWRCKTDTGEKLNIFLNVDEPSKDNFHLFEETGWGHVLNEIDLYGEIDASIVIAMRKDGQWWEIVKVKHMLSEGENEKD